MDQELIQERKQISCRARSCLPTTPPLRKVTDSPSLLFKLTSSSPWPSLPRASGLVSYPQTQCWAFTWLLAPGRQGATRVSSRDGPIRIPTLLLPMCGLSNNCPFSEGPLLAWCPRRSETPAASQMEGSAQAQTDLGADSKLMAMCP